MCEQKKVIGDWHRLKLQAALESVVCTQEGPATLDALGGLMLILTAIGKGDSKIDAPEQNRASAVFKHLRETGILEGRKPQTVAAATVVMAGLCQEQDIPKAIVSQDNACALDDPPRTILGTNNHGSGAHGSAALGINSNGSSNTCAANADIHPSYKEAIEEFIC